MVHFCFKQFCSRKSKKQKVKRRYLRINYLIIGLLFSFFAGIIQAQEMKDKIEVKTVAKEIMGEVSYIGPNFISVIYKKDVEEGKEYEIVVYIDEKVKVEHRKSLEEIKPGDRVRVKYVETTEITEKGEKSKRIAKVVTFVGLKVKGLRSE